MDAEADLMVALEGLKFAVAELTHDSSELTVKIDHTNYVIGVNTAAINENKGDIGQNVA